MIDQGNVGLFFTYYDQTSVWTFQALLQGLGAKRHAPRFGNGDLHLQQCAPDTVAIKPRSSASISSGSSSAAKCPPRGMSVQCTML